MPLRGFIVDNLQGGLTVTAFLRSHLSGQSWNQIRNLIGSRRVTIGGDVCLDPVRRVREGEQIAVAERAPSRPPTRSPAVVRHADTHLVVVEKPAGISTVRH